jgi:signal peptide peptidase SppA
MINPAYELLGRLSHEPMLLSPTYLGLPATIRAMLSSGTRDRDVLADTSLRFGGSDLMEMKPYAMVGDVAVIPVHGTLLNRFAGAWGVATGYDYIRNAFTSALADPSVKGIVFDVNSPGGDAQGCFEACEVIRSGRDRKPTMALVNANAMSGAFAIAAAAGTISVVPSARVGSVGVVTMHVDYSKALDAEGISVTFVYAGAHKVDGNPYEPLPKSVKNAMQTRVDSLYSTFVAQVALDRGMSDDSVRATEAGVFDAQEALRIGLIDRIADSTAAFSAFVKNLSPTTFEATTMDESLQTIETPEAAVEPAAVESAPAPAAPDAEAVAAAERERVAAILGCEEAKDRSALANHLAFKTNLSLENARSMLAAAAVEAKPAAESPFLAAMDSDSHPEVGASASPAHDEPAPNTAAAILRDYYAATGSKPKTIQ